MANSGRDWLVRTRTGEILGPFNTLELAEGLRKIIFTAEDEISPSKGHWVSAQGLTHHDLDEVTRTSTRSEAARVADREQKQNQDLPDEELTPTPDLRPPPVGSPITAAYVERQAAVKPAVKESKSIKGPRSLLLVVLAISVIVTLWLFVISLHPKASKTEEASQGPVQNSDTNDEKNPVVHEAYDLIHQGKNSEALKKLTEYHTQGPAKEDVDYLVPYAALLIQENESTSRAKKLLEQVLETPGISPKLKAKAHHWLGFILLSAGEGDMGESHFLEALELNPKDSATRFNLGRTYLKQEKFQQALDYLQLAELETPDLWIIHIYKGRARMSIGHLDEARASFRVAMEKAPERWMTYIYYALFEMNVHAADDAQTALRHMLTHDPSYEVNSPVPFGFYQEKVNYSEYLDAYLKVMASAPAGEGKELGKLYINYIMHGPAGPEGKRIETMADLGNLTAKVLALKVCIEKETTSEDLQKAIQRANTNLDVFGYYAYVLRGMAKGRVGDDSGSDQDLEKALQLDPKAAIAHFALANLLKKEHRDADARSEMNHLLAFHPDYIPAILALPTL